MTIKELIQNSTLLSSELIVKDVMKRREDSELIFQCHKKYRLRIKKIMSGTISLFREFIYIDTPNGTRITIASSYLSEYKFEDNYSKLKFTLSGTILGIQNPKLKSTNQEIFFDTILIDGVLERQIRGSETIKTYLL